MAVLIVATTLFGVPAIIGSVLFRNRDLTMHLGRMWSRVMLSALGSRVEYSGLDHIDRHGPCVFISNHTSSVDIWALACVLPPHARFVAKQELRRVPVMGWAMAASGFVFVDRANRTRAIKSLEQAAEKIRGGLSVVLFAEGTRSLDGCLQPFKKGPFHLALRAAVPIVPVAISGSWGILQPRSLRVTPGVVRVRFEQPIDVAAWPPDDVAGLTRHVHAVVRAALGREEATAS